jgi:hypothetical protein
MSRPISIHSTFSFLAIFLVLLTSYSCSDEKELETGLTTINLVDAYSNAAPVNLSDFASDIEYIRLETSENTFYKSIYLKSTLGDSMILMKSTDRISLFDRKTGTYLKDIGHKGDDPEGFSSALYALGVNVKNKTVYARGKRFDLYEYSLGDGLLVNTIPGPEVEELDKALTSISFMDISLITSQGIIDDELGVGYFMNIKGNEPYKLVVYDFNGEVLKIYPNHQSYEKRKNGISIESADFHNYNNALFFKENFNDTVFNVGADTLKPALLYELGEYSPPYREQENLGEKRSEYMFPYKTLQSSDFVFYNVSFKEKLAYGYYNRKTKEAFLSDPSTSDKKTGYTNDIDNFVSFYPTSINEKGEMMGLITAEEVYEWFQNNPDRIASLPENLQALQNIEPEDNPVVMIAKLK